MVALHPVLLVAALVRHLPRPVKQALDRWSAQVARERARRRRDAWLRKQAVARAQAPQAPARPVRD